MSPSRSATSLMIYIEQTDHHGSLPAYVEIVERARKAGLAGATVLEGVEGFGASSTLHRQHVMSVVEDVPVIVVIVDADERISTFLSSLDDMDLQGVIICQPVQVVGHRAHLDGHRGARK